MVCRQSQKDFLTKGKTRLKGFGAKQTRRTKLPSSEMEKKANRAGFGRRSGVQDVTCLADVY